ncbi:MAG TPA: protein kinase, partial [Pirellulaceae bacterium]|nr:protein kinase [Pirellulaceae bacterium]
MPVSIPEFWKLVAESRLLTGEQCQQLSLNYSQVKGGTADGSAKSLAEWLVSINTLSKYQATVLLNGRAGPFFYSDYKVYDRIDSGRFKGFFRAVHAASNHPVLLQFVTGSAAQDPQQWAYIAAQVQTRLLQPFPHFQRYFEAVDLGAFKFLVAEDLSGESLADFVKRAGRLSPPDACNAIRQAAVALVEIHRWGLAHGDVRPANLWVDGVGNVRLLHDPAFLPAPWNPSAEDKNGTLLARADYAAPEFAHPAKLPDSLTDLYALGCSFYHLLAGQPPFEGGDIAQKFQRHQTAPIQPLAPLGVPEPLGQIVTYLMAKNPAVRFQHAAQVVEQLTSWVEPARRFPQPIAPAQTLPMFEKLLQIRRANPATHHAPSAGHPAPGHAAPGHVAPGHVAAGGPPAGAP